MSKMGFQDPFGHMQHKLWPKERFGVKLAIWLPTAKSRESTRFPCVQVACNTSLESSRRELQLWFRPRSDRRSTREVIVAQSGGTPNLADFGTPIWESRDKKPFGCHSLLRSGAEYTIWGKVVASPESRPWWVLWVQGRMWLVLAPKVLQPCDRLFVWCAMQCTFIKKRCWFRSNLCNNTNKQASEHHNPI
jgi:hypothetical protein